jgi:transposase
VCHVGKKVFLILDGHSVHKTAATRRWLGRQREQIQVFFLPTYAPELNSDELVNHDVKTNALGRRSEQNVKPYEEPVVQKAPEPAPPDKSSIVRWLRRAEIALCVAKSWNDLSLDVGCYLESRPKTMALGAFGRVSYWVF